MLPAETSIRCEEETGPHAYLVQPRERELIARLDQFTHEIGRAHESDAVTAAGGLHAERDHEVGLAGPDRPGDDDVLGALSVCAAHRI